MKINLNTVAKFPTCRYLARRTRWFTSEPPAETKNKTGSVKTPLIAWYDGMWEGDTKITKWKIELADERASLKPGNLKNHSIKNINTPIIWPIPSIPRNIATWWTNGLERKSVNFLMIYWCDEPIRTEIRTTTSENDKALLRDRKSPFFVVLIHSFPQL